MIVDAHLDLAFNALAFGRDMRLPLATLREREARLDAAARKARGTALVTIPELLEQGVGLIFGTLFAGPAGHPLLNNAPAIQYATPEQAHKLAQQQLDMYHRWQDGLDAVRLIGDESDLNKLVAEAESGEKRLGIVPLMEGADAIREPAEVETWWERGLRIIGPAWDDTRYAAGAWRAGGGLTSSGRRLLEAMADLGFILDVSHLSEQSTFDALDMYAGALMASHSNARAIVPGERQLSDAQIRRLAERDGVIGIALLNSFLKAGHRFGERRAAVGLEHVVAHIDHICQVVGDAHHVGFGSDFDSGFGLENIPEGLDGLAGLEVISRALAEYGYDTAEIEGLMGGNWLALLARAWGN